MYYHMYGRHIGQLSVESSDQQGNTTHIWKRGLTSSDQWKLCFTNISSPSVTVRRFSVWLYMFIQQFSCFSLG